MTELLKRIAAIKAKKEIVSIKKDATDDVTGKTGYIDSKEDIKESQILDAAKTEIKKKKIDPSTERLLIDEIKHCRDDIDDLNRRVKKMESKKMILN